MDYWQPCAPLQRPQGPLPATPSSYATKQQLWVMRPLQLTPVSASPLGTLCPLPQPSIEMTLELQRGQNLLSASLTGPELRPRGLPASSQALRLLGCAHLCPSPCIFPPRDLSLNSVSAWTHARAHRVLVFGEPLEPELLAPCALAPPQKHPASGGTGTLCPTLGTEILGTLQLCAILGKAGSREGDPPWPE